MAPQVMSKLEPSRTEEEGDGDISQMTEYAGLFLIEKALTIEQRRSLLRITT